MSFQGRHLDLTRLGFGGASLSGSGGGYGFGPIDDRTSRQLIEAAIENGICVFDTAPIYGFGESERRLGRFLKKNLPTCIISKGGVSWKSRKQIFIDNSPKTIRGMLEGSLRHLRYIDIYMVHWPDPKVDIRETLAALAPYVERGEIGGLGLCNTNLGEIAKAQEVVPLSALQAPLNVYENSQISPLFPFTEKTLCPLITWGTLDKGILSGRVGWQRQFSRPDARAFASWWKKAKQPWKFEFVDQLEQKLKQYPDLSLLDVAILYPQRFPNVSTSLIGFRTVEQVTTAAAALSKNLPDEMWQWIEQKVELAKRHQPLEEYQ